MAYLKQKPLLLILLATLVVMSGCSNAKEQDWRYAMASMNNAPPIRVYVVKTRAKDDIDALNNAASTARSFCNQTDERIDILEHHVKYQGLTDEQKKIIKQANTELDKSVGTFSERDYQVTIRFRCLPRGQEKSMVKVANQVVGAEVGSWWENK